MALTVAAMLPVGTAQSVRSTVTADRVMYRLQPPEGYAATWASLLSEKGHVVGSARDASQQNVVEVRWEPDGRATPLTGLGSKWVTPRAVNDDGIIGGFASTPDEKTHAVTWDASGTPRRLQEPDGYLQSRVEDINNQHVATGTLSDRSDDSWAARWDRDGKPTLLEKPPGAIRTFATGINDSGEIIGHAVFPHTISTAAVRWDPNGKATYLGIGPYPHIAHAWDINNRGTVVGDTYEPVTGDSRAARALRCCVFRMMAGASDNSYAYEVNNRDVFLGRTKIGDITQTVRWDSSGGMVVMKPTPGEERPSVVALNDPGLAVGSSKSHAAVWDTAGNATHLPDEIPGGSYRSRADKINNAGQIIGNVDHWEFPYSSAVIWR
ncbi:hypothetical protein [Streptomyces sp. TLI_053]|uniref:hypothetical protein n=1 Tax=Streptomyces sp. TLI_053 TaxID=1855352 RepID=UPI0013520EB6|nr:hypothetical protein [Streptomyces sp. TLI_053]